MTRGRRILVCAALLCGLAAAAAAHELPDAAQRADHDEVHRLLARGFDVNTTQPDGATALHWAVYRQELALVEALLQAGADVSRANLAGKTAMGLAAETGDAQVLAALLAAGADPNERMRNGETPLMMAARTGAVQALGVLLDAGAEVDAVEDLRGTTALMWAAAYGNADAVRMLAQAGADVAARSSGAPLGPGPYLGQTARERVYQFIEGVGSGGRRVLLDTAGNLVEFDEDGNALNPDEVVMFGSPVPVDSQGREIDLTRAPHLRQLLHDRESGEAWELRDTREILLDFLGQEFAHPPPPSAVAPARFGPVGAQGGGLTPLVYAARIGDIDSARALLDAGADVNQSTYFEFTPLLAAVQNRYYRMAHFLLDHGADPNLTNLGGWSALYLATNNRNIEGGDYPTRQPDADDLEMIVRLLDAGADPNVRMRSSTETRTIFTQQWLHEEGATPFLRAAQSGDLELLHLLLEWGADPSIPTYHGVSPLMVAAGIGWVEGITFEHSREQTLATVKLLLELGADVNYQDWIDHRSALMGAAHKGRTDVIQVLLDHGADPGLYDIGSRDTLHRLGGVVWQAVDYADGLVRIGVQSASAHPEAAGLLRRVMLERGLDPPPAGRTLESICVPAVDGRQMC